MPIDNNHAQSPQIQPIHQHTINHTAQLLPRGTVCTRCTSPALCPLHLVHLMPHHPLHMVTQLHATGQHQKHPPCKEITLRDTHTLNMHTSEHLASSKHVEASFTQQGSHANDSTIHGQSPCTRCTKDSLDT